MATKFEKFKNLLEELFQLDRADLDFGIYRIMNQKRDEIVRFLERDLLPQVKEAFGQYRSADRAVIEEQLSEAINQANALGVDPEQSPKVQQLRQKLADSSVDVNALENDVFSHLYNFFRRYYHQGDFISQRRYKEGVYAIPYEGEEVKLHWANHDQYYVKSSEYFRDYIFTAPSGKRVRVHLVAASTEQDNKKEAPGKERRFVLCEEDPIYEENGELFIRFEYRPDDGKRKQEALNQGVILFDCREQQQEVEIIRTTLELFHHTLNQNGVQIPMRRVEYVHLDSDSLHRWKSPRQTTLNRANQTAAAIQTLWDSL